MRQARRIARKDGNDVSRKFVLASRILLLLMALLLAITPWTEGYRLLDNFPRGQDSELNVIALVAFLGLVLLLTRFSRRALRAIVALTYALAQPVPFGASTVRFSCGALIRPAVTASPPVVFNLPLLI